MKKKKILVAGFLAAISMCLLGAASNSMPNPSIALAEGEEEQVSEVVEETVVAKETESKFQEIWKTYILPAFLSVNISSLTAVIVGLILGLKNRKTHKDYKEQVIKITGLVLELTKLMAEYVRLLGERNEMVNNLLQELDEAKLAARQQIEMVEKQNEKFEQLKKAVCVLVNIDSELAKVSPEFVQSGIAREIVELKNQLLELEK